MLTEQLPSTSRRVLGTALVSVLALGCAFAAWAAQPQEAAAPVASRDVGRVSTPPPKYPGYAFEHNLDGLIVLIVDVAPDGSVAKAVVERSEPTGVFDAAALEAVRKWRFTPAMKDGKPVASRVRVPVEFKREPLKDVEKAPVRVQSR